MTRQEYWQSLVEQMRFLDAKVEVIWQMSQARTVRELRKLCSELPNNGEALHLAHNWLVCRRQGTPEGRKAEWLIRQHQIRTSKACKLKEQFWIRKYAEMQSL